MLHDDVIADPRAFPECWQDDRYGGTVCNSSLRFVTVGMTPPDPNLVLGPGFGSRLSYYGERSKGVYVDPADTAYLLKKWRPTGAFFLVRFDVAASKVDGRFVGIGTDDDEIQVTTLNSGRSNVGWTSAQGVWLSQSSPQSPAVDNVLNVTFVYVDEFTGHVNTTFAVARVGLEELTWIQVQG